MDQDALCEQEATGVRKHSVRELFLKSVFVREPREITPEWFVVKIGSEWALLHVCKPSFWTWAFNNINGPGMTDEEFDQIWDRIHYLDGDDKRRCQCKKEVPSNVLNILRLLSSGL